MRSMFRDARQGTVIVLFVQGLVARVPITTEFRARCKLPPARQQAVLWFGLLLVLGAVV